MQYQININKRFCGPPASGNGGYSCGLIAKHMNGLVEVRLTLPPPLDTPMDLFVVDNTAKLQLNEKLVATAKPTQWHIKAPPAPSIAIAEEAEKNYSGLRQHSLPTCFVCGPDRMPGDGLRIFAGEIDGNHGVFASTWKVEASLENDNGKINPEFVWAALDCPGYFAIRGSAGFALLGSFSARIEQAVFVGDTLVAVGWPISSEGRKHVAGTALFRGGQRVAVAIATWISVAEEAFVAAMT